MCQAPECVVSVGAGTAVRLLLLVAVFGICEARVLRAATVYVRATGDDMNDGSTPALAVRKIGHAASLAKTGDRIVVGPGTYNEGDIAPAPLAGRVSFVADRRGMEVGENPGDIVVDATNFASGFVLNRNLAVHIDGFVIYGASVGIYVKSRSDQVVISNNIVSQNSSNGIYIQDSFGAMVFNNLVYNNMGTGILASGNTNGSTGARIINNTVYKNGNRGIFFAGTTIGSPDGLALNNVLQGNVTAGIQVNAISRDGYLSVGNVFADRIASGTPTDITDIRADPLLVDPSGADGILGGPGYADDDFHLSQVAAGQALTSPAVDAGSDLARHLKLSRASTRTDNHPDSRFVDAGYHYENFSPLPTRPTLFLRYAPLYVSAASGADINDGKTPERALQSVARAFQLARPGNRIRVLPGTYMEGQLTLTNSGKPGRDILVQGSPGAFIDAHTFQRGVLISGRTDVTLVGLDISGALDSGIEIRNGASNITVRRCHLHENAQRGLYINGVSGIVAQANLIDRNMSRGIQLNGGQADIIRNAFVGNTEQGLWAINDSIVDVSASKFVDNGKEGVLTEESTVMITGGTISGSKGGGARFTKSSAGTMKDVAVLNNLDVGVQGISSLVNVSGGTVEGSTRVGVEGFVDPVSHVSNQLALSGTRVCSHQGPGIGVQDTAVTLTDVTLCKNAAEGLRQTNGTLQMIRAMVTENGRKGIAVLGADRVAVQQATIGNNTDNGIQIVTSAATSISGSVIYSNHGDGVTILDSAGPQLFNNLIYANRSNGVLISGDTMGSPGAQFLNNTVFDNSNRGLQVGGSNDKPPSGGAMVLRNIFQGNGAFDLQVNELSLSGYIGDYNLAATYGALTRPGLHDVFDDALFVRAAGVDGILGASGAADDDFHLSQRLAGQAVTSPAVDAGGVDVMTAGLTSTTTRTDGVADSGVADLGYHYPTPQ